MNFYDCYDPTKPPPHASAIAHCGISSPLATAAATCPCCGSIRDLTYTRYGANEIRCGICKYVGEPTTQSAFLAAQLREV